MTRNSLGLRMDRNDHGEYDLDNKTKAELVHEVRFLQHVNDELYEALGPANDDIVSEAYDSWMRPGRSCHLVIAQMMRTMDLMKAVWHVCWWR